MIIDAKTAQVLGNRNVDGMVTGLDNLIPFIYHLHFRLAAGPGAAKLLGIIALLWTIDCFVAFYLTLPLGHRSSSVNNPAAINRGRSFFQRWKPAWLIKFSGSAFRINFDLHRAGGLWLWIMLLIFAWSSVAYNLHKEVYEPVMEMFFDMPDRAVIKAEPIADATAMDWHAALIQGEQLMQQQAELHHFTVQEPIGLSRLDNLGLYLYRVRSSLDVQIAGGMTFVYFSMYDGNLVRLWLPTTQSVGGTISSWLRALHDANFYGLSYRILVCVLGLVIVMLSITGVIIWLKKRRARHFKSGNCR